MEKTKQIESLSFGDVKGRLSSLLGVPYSQIHIIPMKKEEGKAKVAQVRKTSSGYEVLYNDEYELAHELLHIAYTPFGDEEVSSITNAVEDYRIFCLAEKHDPVLGEFVERREYAYALTKDYKPIEKSPGKNEKILLLVCATDDTFEYSKDKLGLPSYLVDKIRDIKEQIKRNPTIGYLDEHIERVKELLDSKERNESSQGVGLGSKGIAVKDWRDETSGLDTYLNDRFGEFVEADGRMKLGRKFKKRIRTSPKSDPIVEAKFSTAIRRLMKKRELVARYNTTRGRLNSKRVGRYPSNFLFTKRGAPAPSVAIYMLVDLSGSMTGESKLGVVVQAMNAMRNLKVKNLKIHIRGFNCYYWEEWEIGRTSGEVQENNISKYGAGSYNDDAWALSKILKEMDKDSTENKKLIILSDGAFAPSGEYPERDLHAVARGIRYPYVSIGILSEEVRNYYKNTRVANNVRDVASIILGESAGMLK